MFGRSLIGLGACVCLLFTASACGGSGGTVDAGSSPDTSKAAFDASLAARDATLPGLDAAEPGPDAALPGLDAAQPGPDAATLPDVTFEAVVVDPITAAATPLTGALVAFDRPGGARETVTTKADGLATFRAVDWSKGKGAATAYLAGYTLTSAVNLDQARFDREANKDGALLLPLQAKIDIPGIFVTVSGTATNFKDPSHHWSVGQMRMPYVSEWTGKSTQTFTVAVLAGMPFSLRAIEYEASFVPSMQGRNLAQYSIVYLDFPALTANKKGVVFDLSTSDTIKSTSVSTAIPARAESPLHMAVPWCYLQEAGSANVLAGHSHEDISADGTSFEATFAWSEHSWVTAPFAYCLVSATRNQASFTSKSGYPTDGPLPPLIDIPTMTAPAPSEDNKPYPLHQPIAWQLFDDVPATALLLYQDDLAREVAWTVYGGANATTITVPVAPVAEENLFDGPVEDALLVVGSAKGVGFDRCAEVALGLAVKETP